MFEVLVVQRNFKWIISVRLKPWIEVISYLCTTLLNYDAQVEPVEHDMCLPQNKEHMFIISTAGLI
jgi:hypothetical protein